MFNTIAGSWGTCYRWLIPVHLCTHTLACHEGITCAGHVLREVEKGLSIESSKWPVSGLHPAPAREEEPGRL